MYTGARYGGAIKLFYSGTAILFNNGWVIPDMLCDLGLIKFISELLRDPTSSFSSLMTASLSESVT